jgi:hypothetical protein
MIDWPGIINRLRSKIGSLEKAARDVGSCPVHLRRLSRGETNEPKFSVGVKLLDMHLDHCPDDHKDITL